MAVTENGRVIIFGAAADAITDYVFIDHVRWVKPTTAADDLSLTNTAGDEILAAAADADLNDHNIPMNGFPSLGIIVATLDSGVVYVYLKPGQ